MYLLLSFVVSFFISFFIICCVVLHDIAMAGGDFKFKESFNDKSKIKP